MCVSRFEVTGCVDFYTISETGISDTALAHVHGRAGLKMHNVIIFIVISIVNLLYYNLLYYNLDKSSR